MKFVKREYVAVAPLVAYLNFLTKNRFLAEKIGFESNERKKKRIEESAQGGENQNGMGGKNMNRSKWWFRIRDSCTGSRAVFGSDLAKFG